MKKLAIVCLTLSSSFVLAHGSYAEQAADAVHAATQAFKAAHPKEVQRKFISVSAFKTGHEQFAVSIQLNDQTQFQFACVENEEVDPVVWECVAQ